MQKLQLFQKPMLLLALLLVSTLAFSQVTEQWVKRYDGGGNMNDFVSKLTLDASGNVYIAGRPSIIKYDTAGNQLWKKNVMVTDLAVDTSGNVYVITVGYITKKYDAAGNELWVRQYNGPRADIGEDHASALAVDASGNVYVTGWSYNSENNLDYVTIRYDTAGNQLWVKRYNGPGNYEDIALSLALDASGNVYVTGWSGTVKYDASGNELWVKSDFASLVAVDASGNVYVTGGSADSNGNNDYATVKYDSSGNELWIKRYNGPGNSYDEPTSLAVDADGNVYVTGRSTGSGTFSDYATIKYDTHGNELWLKRYNGPGNYEDFANSLAVDSSGNVYVTGGSYSGSATWNDYATIKYDAFGNELWIKRYNGNDSENRVDIARSLALDALGNVYVTGSSDGSGTGIDYLTIKYSQTQTVSTFTLINSDSNKDIQGLKDGDTINLAALASPRITMRANTSPAVVGSVLFRLSGPFSRKHIENNAPYTLFANRKSNYYGRTLPAGNYTLTATPYSTAKGKGTKGMPHTVHFTVTNTALNSLTQADATSVLEINLLKSGSGIDLAALPNPFASQTTIRFTVPASGYTTVQVYDSKGLVVERLYQAWAEAGKTYQVPFKSKGLQNGVYMLRVATGKLVQSGKLVLIR